jgi:hypothetical protein
MSLTEPPPEQVAGADRPPSRRFTLLFVMAMLLIAVGYMWVWHAKTSRVVAEPPPDLVLGRITSQLPGHDSPDVAALRDSLAVALRSVPRLVLLESEDDIAPAEPVPGRLPPRVYRLDGAFARDTDGRYTLELGRFAARTDSVVYIYRVRGRTLPETVHRMAVQVAMSFGLARPAAPAEPARRSAVSRPTAPAAPASAAAGTRPEAAR